MAVAPIWLTAFKAAAVRSALGRNRSKASGREADPPRIDQRELADLRAYREVAASNGRQRSRVVGLPNNINLVVAEPGGPFRLRRPPRQINHEALRTQRRHEFSLRRARWKSLCKTGGHSSFAIESSIPSAMGGGFSFGRQPPSSNASETMIDVLM